MSNKKMIPCRVCGKLFEPCSYCQSHSDIFRWRNFACSRECAVKYINDTIAYRETIKNKKSKTVKVVETVIEDVSIDKLTTTRKKAGKKNSTTIIENAVEIKNKNCNE